jgi:hypothetical protein
MAAQDATNCVSRRRTSCWAAAVASLGSLTAPQAFAWTQSFVVEWYEPAFYYGATSGVTEPGTDCPGGTIPELDWRRLLKTSYRTDADIDKLLDPEAPQRARMGGIRGPNKENVYEKPWSVPDGGTQPVTGNLAFGFDLDDDPRTGFTSPDGSTRGIDNASYRTNGCLLAWRGPPHESTGPKYANDRMREGQFTVLLTLSGTGTDWRNDSNVQIAFYTGKDKIVRDANGAVARDYSFRINPDKRFQSVLTGRSIAGVIETTEAVDIVLKGYRAPLNFKKGRLRLQIKEDGSLEGLIGGYLDVEDAYREMAGGGAINELVLHVNIPNFWWALHKNADGIPDPTTGKNTAISSAWRLEAQPAFVTAPDGSAAVTVARLYEGEPMPDTDRRRRRAQPGSGESGPQVAEQSPIASPQ